MTTLSEEALLDLMAYADGELDGEAKVRVEALIAEDADAARAVAEMRTLGDCVRVIEAARPVPDSVASIADHVMVQVNQAQAAKVAAAIPIGVRRRRAALAAMASGVVALAAGWMLFVHHPDVSMEDDDGEPQAVASASAPLPVPDESDPAYAATEPSLPPSPGVNVDTVESPHQVSVFYVPAVAAEESENASSVIVWIGDNP